MSGWYPDPGGEPDRYRYWDGSRWSPETVRDPSRPPPAPASSSARRGLSATVIVLVAVVVLASLITGWLVRESGSGRPYTNEVLPSVSLSGGDDSSPDPTPQAPSRSASPRGDGLCVRGEPNTRDAAPADGRVHGGNLSFPAAAEFDRAGNEPRFSFAWDVSQQIRGVHDRPGWIAQLAVGRVRAADGFDDGARRVAEQLIRCTVTSNMYEPYDPSRRDRRSAAFDLGGARGWLLETDITVRVSGLPFAGDRVHLIVVPDGDDYGFFFSATPIGDAGLAAVADRVRERLALS